MIHDIIGSGILVAVGAGGMWLAMRFKVADLEGAIFTLRDSNDCNVQHKRVYKAALDDATEAHSRLSDAHNSTKERIERALECETPGANATVQRMARILKGAA